MELRRAMESERVERKKTQEDMKGLQEEVKKIQESVLEIRRFLNEVKQRRKQSIEVQEKGQKGQAMANAPTRTTPVRTKSKSTFNRPYNP